MPATEQEWQVRAATARLWLDDAVVVRARELLRGRGSNAFTRFDGNLSGVSGLPDYARRGSDRVADVAGVVCDLPACVLRRAAAAGGAARGARGSARDLADAGRESDPQQPGRLRVAVGRFAAGVRRAVDGRATVVAAGDRGGSGRPVRGGGADRTSAVVAARAAADPRRPDGAARPTTTGGGPSGTRRWWRASCGSGSTASRRWRSRYRRAGAAARLGRQGRPRRGTGRSTSPT